MTIGVKKVYLAENSNIFNPDLKDESKRWFRNQSKAKVYMDLTGVKNDTADREEEYDTDKKLYGVYNIENRPKQILNGEDYLMMG